LAGIAYRRPLTGDEEAFFREMPFVGAEDAEAAVRRAVIFMLQSPSFLYADLTPTGQVPDQHAIASRLSLALWDSIPDEPLRQAAASGQLATRQQIEAQARRMLDDPRTKAKMRDFFHHWLEVDDRDLAKDREMFPEFDEGVVQDLRYSLDAFLEDVLWSDSSDYRQLLLANYLVLNDRLSDIYQQEADKCSPAESDAAEPDVSATGTGEADAVDDGAAEDGVAEDDAAEDDVANNGAVEADAEPTQAAETGLAAAAETDFRRVEFAPDRRVGVLTHPYLLSAFAYHNNTSPIHRGVFLTRNIVGRPLKPPPAAVAFKDDEFAPDLTMREKITQLTRDAACMSCHSVINPLGFALENYDAVGRWRTNDKDKPVDSRSQYTTAGGETLELRSARDIAEFAAGSKAAHRAFVTQVFKHLVKQNPVAYGSDTVERLRHEFAADNFNMQNLLVRVAVRTAMHGHDDGDTASLEVQTTQTPTPLPPLPPAK
jgi:hypothetical protein